MGLVREAICHSKSTQAGPLCCVLRSWGDDLRLLRQAGQVPGTDQHLLTLHSNYSALQILSSTYQNEVPVRAVTGHVLYLRERVAGAEMDCTHVVSLSSWEDPCLKIFVPRPASSPTVALHFLGFSISCSQQHQPSSPWEQQHVIISQWE